MTQLWAEAEAAYRRKIVDTLPVGDASTLALDVGCDDGEWTEIVRNKLDIPPERVAGMEIVPERAELARARGFDVRIADLNEDWPFRDRSFDVVHANQVIEHVTRLDHFVQETRRVLRPGGRAVICTENLGSWHNVAALALGYQPFSLTNISARRRIGNPLALHAGEPVPRESWQHVHVLSLAALRDIFAAHGFTVKAGWGAGYHPFRGRLASRLAKRDPGHAHFIGVVAERRHEPLVTIAAALYVFLPFDVIPDFMPVVGHFDDALVVSLVVIGFQRRWTEKIRRFMRRRSRTTQPETA
jgi:SAM-dependent methyltransferase